MNNVRVCSRCHEPRPVPSFENGTRIDSWCRDCRSAARREWKVDNADNVKALQHLHGRATYSPYKYAKAHCDHIAKYADRAISRFQRMTLQEAPPQLTAILQLARSLSGDVPEDTKIVVQRHEETTIVCADCRASLTYIRTGPTLRKLCDGCVLEHKRKRNHEKWLRRKSANASEVAAWKAARAARRELRLLSLVERGRLQRERNLLACERAKRAAELRAEGWLWREIADCLGYANPSGPHLAAQKYLT